MRKVFAIIKGKALSIALSIILVVILSLVVFNSIKIVGIESDIGYIRQALTGHGLFWGEDEGIKGDVEEIREQLEEMKESIGKEDVGVVNGKYILFSTGMMGDIERIQLHLDGIESQLDIIESQLSIIEMYIR